MDKQGRRRIQADPMSARIADALREAIVAGELKDGEALTQDRVARMFSVSTMPVREALLALVHEGMLTARPNRGFRVARMARQDIEDVYWAHGVLAGRLTRRACERGTPSVWAELEQNLAESELAVAGGELETLTSLCWDFHRAINLAADSPKISALLRVAIRQIPRNFYVALTEVPEWSSVCITQHRALITALRRRNVRKAEACAVEHVSTTRQLTIEYLAAQDFWDDGEAGSPETNAS